MKEDKEEEVGKKNVELQRGFSVICMSDVLWFVCLLIFPSLGWIFCVSFELFFWGPGN